jgi:hypothetical protein
VSGARGKERRAAFEAHVNPQPPVELLEVLAATALAAVAREYPHHQAHLLESDDDSAPPRRLHPVFYGSFDWHSSVHGHWTLVRLLRVHANGRFAAAARAHLAAHLRTASAAAEMEYLTRPGREGFERPYGLAWLLCLCTELREWGSDESKKWHTTLAPLETHAAKRLGEWLARLPVPVRSGEHSQSALAMSLALDWARAAGARDLEARIATRALTFYGDDRDAPIAYEPSAHDFLSPILAEADLMRRLRPRGAFAAWFERLLPDLVAPAAVRWLTPVKTADATDGKLAHWAGLNASRAWMLEGVVSALPADEGARGVLAAAAAAHREAALAAVRETEYMVTHWLASFVTYLVTERGLPTGR